MQFKASKVSKVGFTLIELLVVIAIIAILAAILFPVFAQARKAAYKAVGQSNLKQATLAILMYEQDYDEYTPRAGWGCQMKASPGADDGSWPNDTIENSCGATEWQNVIQPYVKNVGLYSNPGDASTNPGPKSWGGTDLGADDGHFSFVINDLLGHTMPTDAGTGTADASKQAHFSAGQSIASMNSPADCVLLMEGTCGWNKIGGQGVTNSTAAYDTLLANGKTCRQDPESKLCKEQSISGYQTQLFNYVAYDGGGHNVTGTPFYSNGGNVAFNDGHVKFIHYNDASGKPVLCSSLPWTKSIDPQQRGANNTAAYCDPANAAGPGDHTPQSNWN